MKYITTIYLLFISFSLSAQRNISTTIQNRISKGINFEKYLLFNGEEISSNQKLGGLFRKLRLDGNQLLRCFSSKPSQLEITIPGVAQNYTLKLIRSFIIDDNAKFTVSDARGNFSDISYEPPLFYHGIVDGMQQSTFVAATISKKEGAHFFISINHKNIQVSKMNDTAETDNYGTFENLPGNNEAFDFSCGTKDGISNSPVNIRNDTSASSTGASPFSYNSKVVRCFFDCAYTYYQQNGSSTSSTFNRITTLFNQAALCYANESINFSISQIRVWTSPDPYNHLNRSVGIASFKNAVQNAWLGDIAMLCDWTSTFNSGLADGIGVLCQPYGTNDGLYIYNDLNYNNSFSNFPVSADAPAVYLIIHEIGHIVGSRHTQWCGWAGGPIDNCAAVEGSCSPGPTPSSGTIMSYCCTNSAIGIDFNNGFGPQPGTAIRDYINRSCVGNGTGTCDSTLYLQNPINNTDFTKFEVSNMITASCVLSSSSNVLFDAGKKVLLKPGFGAPAGSYLHIVNEGCLGTYSPTYRVFYNK